ncbi:Glycosyltransferase involved in cell wall bisynthesis [Fibrobacter sp. UWB16]|uniref:glycosyltransferase family 2 protein n=1 Tax=Fibrobacter sp. UWB16 TaxID=1945874 RepID=UPI000BCED247|nr:glycosyltransferase family 2 protein [Fibrobacter sp. UWB16]SOD12667.1 Glycosyltransferase involved in cell wall bisynthesis [Fibrobacter sp. UWB16]
MIHPLVSIIVPIYKVEPYLRRCLDSIVNQTYANLEIILVDDGSPDGCPQICDEYAAKDKRIVVIHKQNGGLSDARNVGLDICKGEFISFVDSDDWVDEKYIEELFKITIKENTDIAIAENIRTTQNTPKQDSKSVIKTYSNKEAIFHLFSQNHLAFIVSWGKIYKQNLFSTLRFPIGKFHEDEFTTYLLFNKSKKISYTSKILYFYFQRTDSIMGNQHPHDLLEAEEKQFDFILKNNMIDLLSTQAKLICWQILYINSISSNENLKIKLYYYEKYLKKQSNPFIHYFLLKIFCKHPYLYTILRKISPFHIRK